MIVTQVTTLWDLEFQKVTLIEEINEEGKNLWRPISFSR